MRAPHDFVHRRMGRDLAAHAPEQGNLPQRHPRPDAVAQHAHEQLSRLAPALGHVDVRIGIVAQDRVGLRRAERRVIAVEIGGHEQRARRSQGGARARDHVAVGVVDAVDDHGAVQIEQHAVDGPLLRFGLAQPLKEFSLQRFVSAALDQTGRIRERPEQRNEFELLLPRGGDKAPRTHIRAGEPLNNFLAAKQPEAALEIGERRATVDKRRRLVKNAADRDAHRSGLS